MSQGHTVPGVVRGATISAGENGVAIDVPVGYRDPAGFR
jgi:hypothetical protein